MLQQHVDMIAQLDAEAFEKAGKIVKKRFSEQVHLDDVQELRAEYKKKLSSIELQLSGMVQVKLDGVKRAMDVIKAANDQMLAVRSEFDGMHDLCRKAGESGKLLFDAYPRLKMINRARKNLERTLKEVTYYANLPSRVDLLVKLLEKEPLKLRQVYLEGQQLEMWRDELLRELKTQQATFRAPVKDTGKGGPASVSDRMQATFGVHLEEVKKLLDAIRKKIFDNISNCFEIVQIDPHILVLTLEIIDMHAAFQKQKADTIKERAEKNSENVEEALALSLIEDLSADIVTKLKQKVDERATGIFAHATTRSDPKQSHFSAMLGAATRIILDLTYLKAEVVPCFPEKYAIMDTFRNQYERHLVQQIGTLYQKGFVGLDQGELLQLMEWLDYYNQEIVNLGAVKPCPEFVQALSVCLQEYLVRVRNQMTEWFTNILNRDQEVATNSAGQPITSTPEDFFNIIHLQVLVALSKLSADNMCAVIVVCLNVIKAILEETLNRLKSRKGSDALSLEILCATVNDYDRLQEKIQEFRDELEQMGKLTQDHLSMVDAAVDQVLDGFVSIADEANSGTMLVVLKDVREAFAEELFTPEWEDSVDVMMQRVTMTFQDYYNDLGRKDEKKKPFRDPLVVAQKIRNDRQALSDFFNNYEEELKQAGLREVAALELQLVVMDHIVDVFEGGVAVESEATAPLLREFGSWGVEALVTISHLRGDKDKARTELKDSLGRYFDKFIKPNLPPPPAPDGPKATGTYTRFLMSPFDPEVDQEAVLTGVKKPPKSKK